MTTILFSNGQVIDGSGGPAFAGSVLVDGDRIAAVVKAEEEVPAADAVMDLKGMVIAPGFIDMHSHSDWVLPAGDHPEILRCLIEQGITSVVGGNCGISPAPIVPETVGSIEALASIVTAGTFEYRWRTMEEFLDRVQETGPILNLAELVGHASIRYHSADTIRGAMTADELDRCLDQTRLAFDQGACGFSLGLGYDPGMYSPLEELEAFCSVAAKANKPVTVHLKALSKISPCYPLLTMEAHNGKALKEMLALAGRTGVKLQLSHFIFVGRKTWSTTDECIRLVEDAQAGGTDVMIDGFADTCGNTTILAPFPYWFLAGVPQAYDSLLARARLKAELTFGFKLVGFGYKDFQVMDAAVSGWEDLNGLRITEIAGKWNCSPFHAMLKLAKESAGAALMLFHTYSGEPGNEAPLEKVLAHDLCLFETDVAIKASGYPNPAGLGTFPRILGRYVREKKLFSLENAIRRMTSASAERFGLEEIGLLQSGKAADLVIFDPATVSDSPPEGARSAGKPKGIRHVFINGVHVVKDGSYLSGVRAGRVLRP